LQVTCLRRAGHEAAAELLTRRRLTPGWNPEQDADYPALIERVLADETA
jgi:hypothetical protein